MTARIVYEEKAPHSTTMKALLLGSLFFLAATTLFYGSFEGLAGVTVVVAVAFAFWTFLNMRFRITTEGVEAVMFPFTSRVAYGEIQGVRVMELPWYVGWGLRIWGRRLAYVSMHKPAVAIDKGKGVFRTLVLTTENPVEFSKRVREMMGTAGRDVAGS